MKKLSGFGVAFFTFAGLAGASSVALGAFAAHGLAKFVPEGTAERGVSLFTQATDFQMNHALSIILVTLVSERVGPGLAQMALRASALLMVAAIMLFPTALYSAVFGGAQWWAPYGGTSSMIGWLLFALGALLALRSEGASQSLRGAQPHPAE